jgi:hypothetical protein
MNQTLNEEMRRILRELEQRGARSAANDNLLWTSNHYRGQDKP